MNEKDVVKLLERQAAWQKSRAALTWEEKIRMVEAVRESVAQFAALRAKADAKGDDVAQDASKQRPKR